jgi:hypothetical protein
MKSYLFIILFLFVSGNSSVNGQNFIATKDTLSWMVIGSTPTNHDLRPDIDWYEDLIGMDGLLAKSGKRSAGLALVSSALVPGLGQGVVNDQWIKTGIFVALEGAALYGHFKNMDLGRDLERRAW